MLNLTTTIILNNLTQKLLSFKQEDYLLNHDVKSYINPKNVKATADALTLANPKEFSTENFLFNEDFAVLNYNVERRSETEQLEKPFFTTFKFENNIEINENLEIIGITNAFSTKILKNVKEGKLFIDILPESNMSIINIIDNYHGHLDTIEKLEQQHGLEFQPQQLLPDGKPKELQFTTKNQGIIVAQSKINFQTKEIEKTDFYIVMCL